jgi:hypothetical protein
MKLLTMDEDLKDFFHNNFKVGSLINHGRMGFKNKQDSCFKNVNFGELSFNFLIVGGLNR